MLSVAVAAVFKAVAALGFFELVEDATDQIPQLVDDPPSAVSEKFF
jgi:hypothetical protein